MTCKDFEILMNLDWTEFGMLERVWNAFGWSLDRVWSRPIRPTSNQ